MWKAFLCVGLMVSALQAQHLQDLLLSENQHIAGRVLDSFGRPVIGARIDHSNDRRGEHLTDSEGRFALNTKAPSLVIRKVGFKGLLVFTQNKAEMQLTLKEEPRSQAFPICSNQNQHEGIEGWGASFLFAKIPGITANPQGQDADYGYRTYSVVTPKGLSGIRHGSGPMWSFGIPSDLDIWRSVILRESTFSYINGLIIIDSRGQFQNGKRWRYIGKFGESASYSNVDEPTARLLDRFLDNACIRTSSGTHR